MKKAIILVSLVFLFVSCNNTGNVGNDTNTWASNNTETKKDVKTDKTTETKDVKTTEENKDTKKEIPSGYKEYDSSNYSFNYPDSWKLTEAKNMIQVISTLWAWDLFAENVNFIEQDYKVFNLDYKTFYDQNIIGIKNMLDSKSGKIVSEEDVKVAWKDAKKLIYNFEMQWTKIRTTQYYVDGDGKAYIITFTNKEDAPDEKKEEFKNILESFKLK